MLLINEAGVAGLGGAYFGRPEKELSMRLSYCDFNGSHIFNDLKNLPKSTDSDEMNTFLQKHCNKVLQGFHRLTQFMKSLSN